MLSLIGGLRVEPWAFFWVKERRESIPSRGRSVSKGIRKIKPVWKIVRIQQGGNARYLEEREKKKKS